MKSELQNSSYLLWPNFDQILKSNIAKISCFQQYYINKTRLYFVPGIIILWGQIKKSSDFQDKNNIFKHKVSFRE